MKKVMLLLLCVLLLLPLYGCNQNDEPIEPAATVAPPSDVYVGMPIDEFNSLYPEENGDSRFRLYRFFEDENGNPGVITLPLNAYVDVVVLSVVVYDKTNIVVSEEAFRSLEKNMTMHEVVSYVGNPHGETPDGLCSVWNCDDGQFYVAWKNSPDDHAVLLVSDVRRVNETTGFSESILG